MVSEKGCKQFLAAKSLSVVASKLESDWRFNSKHLMLPQPHRLPGSRIPALLKAKPAFYAPFFILKLTPSSPELPLRIGFIVPAKIVKKAVDRNRLRRLLRQAAHPYLKSLQPGHDLLFLARKPLINQQLPTIKAAVKQIFNQAQLFANEVSCS
jgi:ribonuclease P protein component